MVVRSRGPVIAKTLAFVALIAVVSTLAIYLIYRPGQSRDRRDQEPPVLTSALNTVVENFQHSQNKDGKPLFLLKARRDQSFSDGHHLLEQVELEGYGADGKPRTHVQAGKCLYDQSKGLVHFQENVVVTSEQGLELKTATLDYDQQNDVVSTNDPLLWQQQSANGRSVGGSLSNKDGHLLLRKDVLIRLEPSDEKKKAEAPPVVITAATGEYMKESQQLRLSGNVVGTRGGDEMRAQSVTGLLDDQNNIKQLNADGSAYLKLISNGSPFEIKSDGMQFFFNPQRKLERAVAFGHVGGESLIAPKRTVTGDKLEIFFDPSAGQSVIQRINTEGNAVVVLQAPPVTPRTPNPAERRIRADRVSMEMLADGKNVKSAEAAGKAMLLVTPVVANDQAEIKQLAADRMNAAFFESGNAIETFSAGGHVQSEIRSMTGSRPPRQTWSDKLLAHFERDSQEVSDMTQEGNFRYREGERNAVGDRAIYTAADHLIRLRGGEPAIWDNTSRTIAEEIDVSTNQTKNYGRRRVRTTYYSRQAAGNAAPFGNSKSPVFVTANNVEAETKTGVAIYSGNARAWQDNNFISSDTLTLYRDEKRMTAEGKVKSALSNVERTVEGGRKEVVPIFADAEKMFYSDAKRLVHYENNVRVRQGSDALAAQMVDVYLEKETSQIREMVASRDALYTQPGRKAQGDELTYTAASDKFVLVGNLARVEDAEKGITLGRQLTFLRGESRVFVEDVRGVQRGKSVHKVR